MFKKIILSLALVIVVSAFLFAQQKPLAPSKSGEWNMKGKLNLTEEQKSKIQNFKFDLEKKQIGVRSKLQTLRVEVKQLFAEDKIDKSAIEKKFDEIAKTEVELKKNHLNFWSTVNDILTPDQQKIWKKFAMNLGEAKNHMIKERMGNRMNNRMGMRGQRNRPPSEQPDQPQK